MLDRLSSLESLVVLAEIPEAQKIINDLANLHGKITEFFSQAFEVDTSCLNETEAQEFGNTLQSLRARFLNLARESYSGQKASVVRPN